MSSSSTVPDGQTITLLGGPLSISQYVSIQGPGANQLTIDGNQNSSVFEIAANVSVSISRPRPLRAATRRSDGGGIDDSGNLTVTNCEFFGNTAADTGGSILIEAKPAER